MFWRRDVRHLANAELQKRLVEARRQSAESEAWLDLLELALGESRDGAGWRDAAPPPPPQRPVKTPLLFRAHLTVNRRTARRYVHRLLERAELRLPRLDVAAFLEAAVCQDDARIDALAAGGGPPPPRGGGRGARRRLRPPRGPRARRREAPARGRGTSRRGTGAAGGRGAGGPRRGPGCPGGGAAWGAGPRPSGCGGGEKRPAAVAAPRCVPRAAGGARRLGGSAQTAQAR